MQNIVECIREKAVSSLFSTKTVQKSWPTWKTGIQYKIGSPISPSNIINLGDHMSSIFSGTGIPGRSQSSVSGAGTAWESLVCWYLNLCMIGTRGVAIKHKKSLIPKPIQESITVNYGNFPSNTESDIMVIIFPDTTQYTSDVQTLQINDKDGNPIPIIKNNGKLNYNKIIDRLAELDINDYEIGIIQCKTNWNDNAQVPMLWDIVYSANGFHSRNISIGNSSYSMKHIKKFSYSFMTVPTNKKIVYKPTSTAVQRVRELSGGNYWGKLSSVSVANSIKEIFNRNFSNASSNGFTVSLRLHLPNLHTVYSYFQL